MSQQGSEDLIVFPEHALLIVEERLREQEAERVKMPAGVERDELPLPDTLSQNKQVGSPNRGIDRLWEDG